MLILKQCSLLIPCANTLRYSNVFSVSRSGVCEKGVEIKCHHISLCLQIWCLWALQLVWLCWLESSSPSSSLGWTGGVFLCTQWFKSLNTLYNNTDGCWFTLTFVLVCLRNWPSIMNNDAIDQNSVFDLYDCKIDVSQREMNKNHPVLTPKSSDDKRCFSSQGTNHGTESNFSFFNNLYDPPPQETDTTGISSDA